MLDFKNIIGFDWDKGNVNKINTRHNVDCLEVEEMFFNELILESDIKHSTTEVRIRALGVTNKGREMVLVFTIRKNRIRPISARNMDKKERKVYRDQLKKIT